tara:strand:+ start:238 stop:522 length:285 start_codon:yes stop_codon:yes gene_type:complete
MISGIVCLILLGMVVINIYRMTDMIRLRTNHEIDQAKYIINARNSVSHTVVEEEMRVISDVMGDLHLKEPIEKIVYLTNVCGGSDRFKSHSLQL